MAYKNGVVVGPVSFTGGTANIGSDATDNAINIGTAASSGRTTTVGNTTAASVLALKYGTGDFTLASATGTVINSLDTGEVTMPLQPAFLATLTNSLTNLTGDGTSYNVIFDTEIYDQGSDFNLGTSVFMAPVTGRYHFAVGLFYQSLGVLFTDGSLTLSTSNRNYALTRGNYGALQTSGFLSWGNNCYVDMDLGDEAVVTIVISGSTKTVGLLGDSGAINFFSGVLVV